jgi:IclR family acetate operon transcriptional repressor
MTESHRPRGRPRAFHDKTAQNTIQALDRAIDVLEELAARQGRTLSDLASTLDQSPATVYRVLTTFEARGMTELDPATQTWSVGPSVFRLGAAFLRRMSLVERARPIMRRLMEETGETANLGVERDGEVMFLSQVESTATVRAFFAPGTRSAMHASGIGKALMAAMTDQRLARVLAPEHEAFTRNTLTDPALLRRDIERARGRGFAFDDEERTQGMRCVAAPVTDMSGDVVAGISVSGPSDRMPLHRIDEFGARVREAAEALSEALGARASSARKE